MNVEDLSNKMTARRSFRHFFNVSKWKPKKQEYCHAMSCLQSEERDRIRKFKYQIDAKSSLIGRLFIRSWISQQLQLNNKDIQLSRTDRGRPFLKRDVGGILYDFNVSHAGDFVAFCAEILLTDSTQNPPRIGVDLMPLKDLSREKNVQEFFRLMTRQFTQEEWSQIKTSEDQLATFFRFWCLKESFIKAEGTGLGIDLQSLSFNLKSPLKSGQVTTDTEFKRDGSLTNWSFQEYLIDNLHCSAVCFNSELDNCDNTRSPFIEIVDFGDIASDLLKLDPDINDTDEWEEFQNKITVKPF